MRGPILAGRSILVVEDDPLIALDIEVALRRVGANVLSTAYVWIGLHFAEHPGLSAAVLDLRPGLDDCTAICRRLSKLRVPFMFFTAGTGALLRVNLGQMLRSSASPHAERIVEAVVGMLPRAWPRRAVNRRGSRAAIGLLTH